MKRVSFLALVLTITFASCSLMDNSLINDIVNAAKTEVSAEELPDAALNLLSADYFGTYIEEVLHAQNLGFEVTLSDDSKVYFAEDGDCLNGTEKRGKKGKGKHRGEAIDIAELPAAITDYITTNYPDATIEKARFHEGKGYGVKLDTDWIILFDLEGNFVDAHEFTGKHGRGEKIDIADLPTIITDYVSTNYSAATIRVAFQKEGEYMVGLEENGKKKMLIFDSEGNFVEEKTCND